jgi:hypothetical protein
MSGTIKESSDIVYSQLAISTMGGRTPLIPPFSLFHATIQFVPCHHSVCSVIRAGKKNTWALILKYWATDFRTFQHES